MAQDIKLKIGADTSELERTFATLIKKIQGDADKLKISPAAAKAAPGTPGSQAFQQALQSTRAQQQKTRDEKEALDITIRGLAQKQRELEKISRQEAASVGNAKQLSYLANERNKAEREYQALLGTRKRLEGTIATGGGTAGGSGGAAFGKGGITNAQGLAGALGVPGLAIGAVVTGIAAALAAESARVLFSQTSLRARATEATAFNIQGQGGQRLDALLNGNVAEEMMFNPQRLQGAQVAQQTMQANLAWYNRAGRLLTHPTEAVQAFGRDIGMDFGFDPEITSARHLEQSRIQQAQTEAFKNGPEGRLRTSVGQQYLENFQRNLDFQRQTGLNTETFRGAGGFLAGVQGAGFTDVQGMMMSSGITGAGGSTRSAVGNAALGLQAQRNLDITNAGSVLGGLSGSLGSSTNTKEAFVKILAEGTRLGLDGSEYRSENRKFIETAAGIVSQSGTTTGGGVAQILSQLDRFMSDKTMTGVAAGANAFELYRQTSMAQTGPRATMRAAGMLTDPTLSRLGRNDRMALFNMPIDQLTPDNPAIIAMATHLGKTPQEVIDAQNGVTSRSANLFKTSDMAIRNLSRVRSRFGRDSSQYRIALGEANIAETMEHPELGQNQRMASAFSEALSTGDARGQTRALEEAKKQQLSATTTGRPEDETNRLQAEASRLANQLFMSIKDSIVPASDAVKTFAADIDRLTAAMKGGNASNIANEVNRFSMKYGSPSTQPSAGSPASGPGTQ